jgi:hypothetical protein
MEINPPSFTSNVAPSLRTDQPLPQPDTSLVAQEPAMTSGTVASLASLLAAVALILKFSFGIVIPVEVLNAIADVILFLIPVAAPLVAAKFTRERVTPVK